LNYPVFIKSNAQSGREPKKLLLSVRGMTCAACVGTIENYVKSNKGVISIAVGLLAEKAEVFYDPALITAEQIRTAVDDVGYEAKILDEVRHFSSGSNGLITIQSDGNTLNLSIGGMTCASCVNIIESAMKTEKGIKDITVNLATCTAKVKYDPDLTGPRAIIAGIEGVIRL
jgi:Cu+-exporting ATPase